jgi:hypothetical protein
MYATVNTKVHEERNHEDGFIYSYFVYWVTVVCEATRRQWHHEHAVSIPASWGDRTPYELKTLADRVEDALWNGTDAEHFERSPHWTGEAWHTLEERLAPFGVEWELEQKERGFGVDGPVW